MRSRARTPGTGALIVGALGALAVALAGCGVIPGIGSDPRAEAVPVASVTCPETYEPGYAEGGLVPDDFDAVAVMRCDPYAEQRDADGTWSGVRLETLEGDLEPVLVALATPSDPRSLGACPAIGYVMPELWVEGADGAVVRAAIATDGCGAPKSTGLDAALAQLTVTAETFAPTVLVESTAATDAGCPTQAGLLVLAGVDGLAGEATTGGGADDGAVQDGTVGGGAVGGGAVGGGTVGAGAVGAGAAGDDETTGIELVPYDAAQWPDESDISGGRLCAYASEPTTSADGADGTYTFTSARDLDAVETREVAALAQSAPPADSCKATATELAVVHIHADDTTLVTVELDGCRRIIDPALRTLAAPAELLALVSTEP